jgi:hypothetical protein
MVKKSRLSFLDRYLTGWILHNVGAYRGGADSDDVPAVYPRPL